MAKNAKKGATTQGKPITDFFTLASKPHPQPSKSRVSPSMPSQSSSSLDVGVTETKGVLNKSKVASIVSNLSIESSSKGHGRSFLNGSENRSSTKMRPILASAAPISSLKRVRSPDFQAHGRASTPPNNNKKAPTDRRGKFDSDSDIDMLNTVDHVNSMPNSKSHKKARLSPPGDSSPVDYPVPSSQSDEESLASMKEQSYLPTLTRETNENMEISADNNMIPDATTKAPSADCHNRTPFSTSHLAGQRLTPPSTDRSFRAPSPIPLDPATKTAQIIAQIKERAYAKTHSSPEVAPLEFNDDLDDSSDDDSFFPVSHLVTKPASSKGNTVAATFEDTSSKRTSRYSLRNHPTTRSSSNSSLSPSRGSPSSKRPSSPKVVKNRTERGKKTVVCDPFDALLKEKKLAEKSGRGSDAFRRAETTTGKIDYIPNEMDEDDLDDWNDQDAAALAVRDRDWLINRPLTPNSNRSNGDDLRLGDAERHKLFGEDGGKAIMGILEHDKIAKRDVLNQQVPGLRFWPLPGAHSPTTLVDEAPSIAEISVISPLVCLLKNSVQRGDFVRAALILDTDFLSTVKPIEHPVIVQYLCELVLTSQRTLLSEPASRALENHWRFKTTTCGLSFSQVLAGVQRLGADAAVLSSQQWSVSNMPYTEDATPTELREDFIRRLIIIANICTCARKLRTEEAPDLVLLLLLIGIDVSTPHDLQLDIIQSINLICNRVASENMAFTVALCSKVLNCIVGYEPLNKARLIALLSAGSGSTKRIASFIAYCVIIDRTTVSVEIYSDLPPLDDVLEQLHPSSLGSSKFTLSETTNYLDLGYYISILAIALSNVRGYVTEERRVSQTKHSTCRLILSPPKRMEGPKDLQLIYAALETLHSNISDSKALHLERSRTKAILKGLSMYIHYQRDYWLKHDRGLQSKKLLHYFKKAP